MAGKAFGHDYKTDLVENERLRQEQSIVNWIYIGVDTRFDNMAKIGLTTGALGTRASGSQNPFYSLLCAFKIKEGVNPDVVKSIESAVIDLLGQHYQCISHVTTGRPSEWFYAEHRVMRELVHDFLYDKFNWQMYSYHCAERNIGIIYSWENRQLIHGSNRNSYQANDLSSPPADPACFMPGGCGVDCNCWD
ncbi:hypothetical protein Acife_2567 [Acidithiobacillus ferrivorans SS3]|uniref:Uncharacterized protein n=1 Tax=Acidithiobacillus ferrivorans SS3 TaxID=743299 RepID=G0JQL6_9PROT|nr:hypothetical protein [Acidithiobacillus ferrivorans]AEM48655.1 hypothetical protein Acife_2567 [Acidithiobacillus ferrivorans SS3]MBU2849565.1 hypothetical protein [Acidithiobacillus ferrivorans]